MISFQVRGLPAPQGSKRAFRNQHTGRIMLAESSAKVKPWRQDVKAAAIEAMGDLPPFTGPVQLSAMFYFPRPKGHFGTGRNAGVVKDSAPSRPAGRPDLSKLVRSTEDALTGVVWVDDCQVVSIHTAKWYTTDEYPSGAIIWIEELATGIHKPVELPDHLREA